MLYVDTSVIVAALTEETATERVRSWFDQQSNDSLVISHWVLTEVSSALSLKVRTRALPPDQHTAVLAGWRFMAMALFTMIPIGPAAFDAATRMTERHDLNLRAPDALHIAVARAAGYHLVTLDRTMADAARQLGTTLVTV